MKRKLLLMLLCAALGLGAAQAEVYRVENEADVPADWAEKDTLRLTCIDTNRSDAMVLQSGGEAMMVDGGEGRYRKRVYATLDGYGITELKYLLNTHCDDDHLHGFIYLMYSDLYQVDAFLSPNTTTYVDEEGYHQQAVKATGTKNIPYVQIGDGDELTLGNAKLTIFRCPLPTGQNNRSAACMVQFGDSRAFLTGDIDNETMQWYAATYGEKLRCDILKAPHHGLATIPDSFVEQDTAAGAVRPQPLRPQHKGDGGLGEEPHAGRGALLLRRRDGYDADRRHGLVYLARTELRRPAIRRGC